MKRIAAVSLPVALLIGPMLGSAALAQGQPTLTVSVYAISQDQYKADLYDPFLAICGCKLVFETGNSGERVAKMDARKDNPVIDIAAISDADAADAARKGLIDPIDVSKLGNYKDLYEVAKDPLGRNMAVGYTFYATSIIYRSDKVQITSWADLFDPKLKGRVALPNITTTQGPPLLFMVDKALGGTTPDFAKAIERIGAAKKDITTFYNSSATLPQLFQQEEIWASVVGRFSWPNFTKLNMPIAWASPKEGQTGGMNVLVLTKGSKNRDLALKFMDYWLSAEVQTKLAMDKVDSPANSKVTVPPDIAAAITYGPETAASLKFIPPANVLAQRDQWLKDWNAKVAQ